MAEADDVAPADGAGVDGDAAEPGKGNDSGGVGSAGRRRREGRERQGRSRPRAPRGRRCGGEGQVFVGVREGRAVVVRDHSQERVRERGVDLGGVG